MNLGDMGQPLTEPIDADTYVRTVLVSRQRAWLDAHPAADEKGFPPLLEWFVVSADTQYVQLPEGWTPDASNLKPDTNTDRDGPWCVILAGVLRTGDSVACGRYATVRVRVNESGEEIYICEPCAAEGADAPDRDWTLVETSTETGTG